jgi:probable phosphoglycerate mutase
MTAAVPHADVPGADEPRAGEPRTPDRFSPEHSRTLYLVRHGRTALNAEGRLRGHANPPLDEVGEQEARAVGSVLAHTHPVRVYCSPLDRAVRTAQIIGELCDAHVSPDQRFMDRDYGPWTGEVRAEVITRFGSVDAAPGVEPTASVLERARPALDAVLDDAAAAGLEAPVVVVTHDAVIKPLIAAIDPRRTDLTTPTGSWNELVREGGVWTVVLVDQVPPGARAAVERS